MTATCVSISNIIFSSSSSFSSATNTIVPAQKMAVYRGATILYGAEPSFNSLCLHCTFVFFFLSNAGTVEMYCIAYYVYFIMYLNGNTEVFVIFAISVFFFWIKCSSIFIISQSGPFVLCCFWGFYDIHILLLCNTNGFTSIQWSWNRGDMAVHGSVPLHDASSNDLNSGTQALWQLSITSVCFDLMFRRSDNLLINNSWQCVHTKTPFTIPSVSCGCLVLQLLTVSYFGWGGRRSGVGLRGQFNKESLYIFCTKIEKT